jgi:hypothetical protein
MLEGGQNMTLIITQRDEFHQNKSFSLKTWMEDTTLKNKT